jgi:hypothetical protein
MAGTNSFPAELAGRSIDCDFGGFAPRLTFGETGLRVQATIYETKIDEVVDAAVTTVRPNVFSMSWLEKSGNFIVQVQDHQNGIVHNYARLASGDLFCAQGALRAVV